MTDHTNTDRPADTAAESASLIARACAVARASRAADPHAFDHRYDRPNEWTRRARIARDIAHALEVPLAAVSVTDDPHGGAHADLITVTDDETVWRFIPDFGALPGDRWVMLDECPECEALVPMVPVTGLADIGDWLDPDTEDRYDRVLAFGFFHGDPAHRSGCPYGTEPCSV